MDIWVLAAGVLCAVIGAVLLARAGQTWRTLDLRQLATNPEAPIAGALVAIGIVLIGAWIIILSPGLPGGVFQS